MTEDECANSILTGMERHCESIINEIEERFNDKSIEIIHRFETFRSMTGLQNEEVIIFCNSFPILNAEAAMPTVLKAHKFFIKFVVDESKRNWQK